MGIRFEMRPKQARVGIAIGIAIAIGCRFDVDDQLLYR
jgi:hypothetical protein